MAEPTASLAAQDVEAVGTAPPDAGPQEAQSDLHNFDKEGRSTKLLSSMRILRLHAFIISLFALVLLLMVRFILYHAPLRSYWGFGGPKRATTTLAAWMFATIILTSVAACMTVFRRRISFSSSVIAIIIDIVLTVGIITSAVLFTHHYPHSLWCDYYSGGGPIEAPHPQCWNWKNLSWILMKISFTLAIILAVILVVLIVCQIIAIGRSWSFELESAYSKSRGAFQYLGNKIPYTLNVKISLDRKDGTIQTSEAPLGQGPVHI